MTVHINCWLLYLYLFLITILIHIVVVGMNDEQLSDCFLSLLTVIERTDQFLSTMSVDLLEYCERHLEGHLGIIAAFLQVLNKPGNQAGEMFIDRLQQLLAIVSGQLRRIKDMSTFEHYNKHWSSNVTAN